MNKPAFQTFVLAFLPAVGAFFVVGLLAGGDRFGWDAASVSATGVATATLAFFTARLARSTSNDVAQTRDLVEIERTRFQKEDEPWIVAEVRWDDEDMAPFATVQIANIGRGPAVDLKWEVVVRNVATGTESKWAAGRRGALISGERHDETFDVHTPGIPGDFAVRVVYSDRDRWRVITAGPLPLEGWEQWFMERAEEKWWGLPFGQYSDWQAEHREMGLMRRS